MRSLLGAFLFSGDEVDKKVQVLSGGEKSRVALAKMLVRPANLMLLDEPTNHLDITSQGVLQEAMAQYEGSIIVVSHNRNFVNSFVNKVLEIRDGRAILHEGNIDDYLAARKQLEEDKVGGQKKKKSQKKSQKKAPVKTVQAPLSSADRKEDRRKRAQERQQLNSQIKPWKNKAKAAEKEIEKLEKRKEELEVLMADPDLYADQPRWLKINKEYNEVKQRLEQQFTIWEEAQGKIEEAEGSE
ncbi:MAG: ATP-binding cassette domain-containing protein [Candidatus Electrothrix sp. AR5]|nr:ATP-binding cassette domain-containing protein [Candidatus Electrothrix sp. AR5]